MNKSNNNLSEKVKKTLQGHHIWIESHGKKGKIADLSGLDLRFIDLRKFNLRKAILYNSNLKGSDLSGINFYFANLQGADLEKANLEGAGLEEVNLERANLKGAILERADLKGANLKKADLAGVNLEEACLVEANLMKANLEHANLNYADLEGAILEDSNLQNALINDANLEDTNLDGANLKEAQLKRSNLFCASVDQTDFEGADLEDANLVKVDLDETDFEDAILKGTKFDEKNLQYDKSDTIILNKNEKSTGRKLTPELFTKEVSPYINAISEIKKIMSKAQNRHVGEMCINAVPHGSGIIIEFTGAKEILQFIKNEIIAWRKKHSASLIRLKNIREKNKISIETAKALALNSLIKKNKHDSGKLAAKALKITAEMMRNKVEAEKIRKANNQRELANKFFERTIPGFLENENNLIKRKLITQINLLIESDLAD